MFEELAIDKKELEEEIERLQDNLAKISKKGVDIISLLKSDMTKCKETLQALEQKVSDTKQYILQGEDLKVVSEKNLDKFLQELKATRERIQGKLNWLLLFRC